MRSEVVKRSISCDGCGTQETSKTGSFEALQMKLLNKGWLILSQGEYCFLCRVQIEKPKFQYMSDEDKQDVENFFNSSLPPQTTDDEVLNMWFKIVNEILERRLT